MADAEAKSAVLKAHVDASGKSEVIGVITKVRISFEGEAVDATAFEYNSGGVRSVNIHGICMLTDAGVRIALSGEKTNLAVKVPTFPNLQGPFWFSQATWKAGHGDAAVYEVTLESAGQVLVAEISREHSDD